MMWLAFVIFAVGIAFGFFHKGTEDYRGLLRNGAIIGVVVSVVLLLLSMLLLPAYISSGFAFLGAFGILIEIVVCVIIFVIGAFAGDQLERVIRK